MEVGMSILVYFFRLWSDFGAALVPKLRPCWGYVDQKTHSEAHSPGPGPRSRSLVPGPLRASTGTRC
eukprot:10480734-Karenia_brevis.AAC.1